MSTEFDTAAEDLAFVGALVVRFPQLVPLFAEHLNDYEGEPLAYVFLPDVVRWMAHLVGHDEKVARDIFKWLEFHFQSASEGVRSLILLGVVECIPERGESGSVMRLMLGPLLKHELQLWDGG